MKIGTLDIEKKTGAQPGNKNAYNPKAKTRHPLYETWRGMKQRCRNPNHHAYKYYGGKGVTVCERWNNFEVFLEDMGSKPVGTSLDRIDSTGIYEPSNCRWATAPIQYRFLKQCPTTGKFIE